MIVQWTRRDVPDLGVRVRRLIVREPSFVVMVLRSEGVAHDWGIQSEAVSFIARLHRTQLSLLLEGRGYMWTPSGPHLLEAGDTTESDQGRMEVDGYAGSPLLLVQVEYERDGLFGPAHRGAARFSRLARSDVSTLRSICERVEEIRPAQLVLELARVLRTLGYPVTLDFEASARPRLDVGRVFGAMGDAISQIERQPSLTEVAGAVDLTERQTNRHIKELSRAYAHPIESWREFIHDVRIGVATQILSIPNVPLAQVAKLSGYGSAIALCHALSARNAPTPGEIARRLAERWR